MMDWADIEAKRILDEDHGGTAKDSYVAALKDIATALRKARAHGMREVIASVHHQADYAQNQFDDKAAEVLRGFTSGWDVITNEIEKGRI